MTTSSDRYSGETGLARINGVIDYLLELQGEVDNDERQHLEIMIADLRQAVMCVRAAEYRAKCAVEERDEARRWLCHVLAKPTSVMGLAVPGNGTKHDFAKEQGWDCFEEPKAK